MSSDTCELKWYFVEDAAKHVRQLVLLTPSVQNVTPQAQASGRRLQESPGVPLSFTPFLARDGFHLDTPVVTEFLWCGNHTPSVFANMNLGRSGGSVAPSPSNHFHPFGVMSEWPVHRPVLRLELVQPIVDLLECFAKLP